MLTCTWLVDQVFSEDAPPKNVFQHQGQVHLLLLSGCAVQSPSPYGEAAGIGIAKSLAMQIIDCFMQCLHSLA